MHPELAQFCVEHEIAAERVAAAARHGTHPFAVLECLDDPRLHDAWQSIGPTRPARGS